MNEGRNYQFIILIVFLPCLAWAWKAQNETVLDVMVVVACIAFFASSLYAYRNAGGGSSGKSGGKGSGKKKK